MNTNRHIRPNFMKDRVMENPHKFPRPEYAKAKTVQVPVAPEVAKSEAKQEDEK